MSYIGGGGLGNLRQHNSDQHYGGYGSQNGYGQMNNQMAALQQQRMWNAAHTPKDFRINGKDMHFEEFVNTLFPEDCAERTYLILKLKGKEDDTKSS